MEYIFDPDKFFVIAGPCVIEGLEICLETGKHLKEICDNLGIEYIFKASYDKANRSSVNSFRGPGLEKGLKILGQVRSKLNIPILTDVHSPREAEETAKVVDIIQIPAFLCRQTDLLLSAGKTNKHINIKKGQFMAPWDMKNAVEKVYSTGNKNVILTERGSFFGYNNLVNDMRSLIIMRKLGVPVVFDATHSVQLPGGAGSCSSGNREYVLPLARAAAAVGIDGVFMEIHPNPEKALCDGPNSLFLSDAENIIKQIKDIYDYVKQTDQL